MFVLPLIPPPEVLFPMRLATFDTDLGFLAGCVEVRPLKPDPRTRFRVLPLTADTSLSCAAGISFSSVSASGSSDVDPYSMIVLLEALALPVPRTLEALGGRWFGGVAARPAVLVAFRTWTCTLF